jgi:uncharacterized protein YbjQ (UPF0145 family)
MGVRVLKAAAVSLAMLGAGGVLVTASAQQKIAAQVMLIEGDAPQAVTVLGVVTAEIHQKSMMPKTPSKTLAEQELREKAAKMGADAVIKITYSSGNALTTKKGFTAQGVAVKFANAAAPTYAAAAPAPAPVAPPQSAPQMASAAPVQAAPQVALAAPAPAPTYSAPAAPRGPTPAAAITLSEQDLTVTGYRLGQVRAVAHQKSLFAKKPAKQMLDEALRAQAAKMGADAVVLVTYDMNNPMMSKKGSTAVGYAVRYGERPAPVAAAPAPVAMPQAAPSAAVASAAPTYVPPAPRPPPPPKPVVVPASEPVSPANANGDLPAGVYRPAQILAARAGATDPTKITLSETDAAGRAYTKLGEVRAEAHQTSMFAKTPARQMLETQLREAAARLGADAVINIKYTMKSPIMSKEGSSAVGVAVKYQ